MPCKEHGARRQKPQETHEREEDEPMSEQRHGQYYAQELVLDATGSVREQIQEALDNAEA